MSSNVVSLVHSLRGPVLRRLWARYDPAVYATIWGFDRHPEKIWELCRDFLKARGTPVIGASLLSVQRRSRAQRNPP